MDFERLETKRSKITFVTIVVLLLTVLFFCLHYIIYPDIVNGGNRYWLLKSLVETLLSSLAVAVIVGIFQAWASPRKKETGELIKILQPYEINMHHRECRKNTFEWWYDGGSGRYTRDVTLPKFVKQCQNRVYDNDFIRENIQLFDKNNHFDYFY